MTDLALFSLVFHFRGACVQCKRLDDRCVADLTKPCYHIVTKMTVHCQRTLFQNEHAASNIYWGIEH